MTAANQNYGTGRRKSSSARVFIVERKKVGLHKARRRPQYSKR